MRIDRLDLTAFGPFTDVSLDLSGGGEIGGLHMIFGLNEAGKSSALRAIKRFFLGIEVQSKDAFVHKYDKLRIGAVLRTEAGAVQGYVRHKRAKNTLLTSDGNALEDADASLTRLLGGVNPEDYVKKFVIDHDELIAGGEEVLKGGGDLGRVLFAASGVAGLSKAQERLGIEAEDLFKKGGKIPKINAALAELEKFKKETKERSLKGSEWLSHDQALGDASTRDEALGRELDEKRREQTHLKRLADALGPIAQRMAVLDELAAMKDVPGLDEDFTTNRCVTEAALKPARVREAAALCEIETIREALAELIVPEELLALDGVIDGLIARLGAHQKSKANRFVLENERAGFEAEARAAFRELGHDPTALTFEGDAQGIEGLRVRAADREEIQERSNQRPVLEQARETSAKALRKLRAKQEDAVAKLAALGPDRDSKNLDKVVKAAKKPGELEVQVEHLRETLKSDTRKAESALRKLGLWSGPLDAVDALLIPLAETIERFEAEFKALTDDETDLNDRLKTLDAESRKGTAAIERLRLTGDVPTEDALTKARAERDVLWSALRQAWDESTAVTFEAAMRRADEISDRLRRETGRVTDRANLLAEQTRQAADRVDLSTRLEKAHSLRDDLNTRWHALWSPLGIETPGTAREMNSWSRKHEMLAKEVRALSDHQQVIATKESVIETHLRALDEALAQLGEPAGVENETLAQRIDRAESVSESIRDEASDRKAVNKDVVKYEIECSDLEEKAEAASAEWDAWQAAWAVAMKRLGLPADDSPKTALAVLDQRITLFNRLKEVRDRRGKLDELSREAALFTFDVQALAARVAPDLVTNQAEPIVVELKSRLAKGRGVRQARDGLIERLDKENDRARVAHDEVIKAQAGLEALCHEARCDSIDELPEIERRSRRKRESETKLADIEGKLFDLAAGAALDAFLNEAAATDPDALEPRIASLDDQIKELNAERGTLRETIGREKTLLGQMSGTSRAAESGQEAEDLRARIKFEVEQYARLRLASAVLRDGIERYREKARGPVVERASSLFAALTPGRYTGLKVDYDDQGEPALNAVRGDGAAVSVGEMSEGTADQLYLALRLATLDLFLDGREPVPLIVDDILIQFDDARASATLKILAGLAERTQVLVFTHHEHLCELARKIAPASRLKTHVLPGPMIPR